MAHPRPLSVPHLVAEGFKELGVRKVRSMSHALLFHSTSVAGEKYECGGIRAIVPRHRTKIVFFNREGEVLKRINVAQVSARAA